MEPESIALKPKKGHAGNITGDNVCRRILEHLRERTGKRVSNWDLINKCKCAAPSTRISEVRRQLDPKVESILTEGPIVHDGERRFFYTHHYTATPELPGIPKA